MILLETYDCQYIYHRIKKIFASVLKFNIMQKISRLYTNLIKQQVNNICCTFHKEKKVSQNFQGNNFYLYISAELYARKMVFPYLIEPISFILGLVILHISFRKVKENMVKWYTITMYILAVPLNFVGCCRLFVNLSGYFVIPGGLHNILK